ncbi:MAG: hypothetical protein CMJ22_01735 [Phycisphaerae bacterium]|nr:hypothetical protein [Phycisphaerae bacterium]
MLAVLALTGLAAATPPSMEDAVAGWLRARAWLDAGTLPAETSDEAGIEIAGMEAVGVLLRMDGRSIGRGDDPAGDDRAVRRALGRALAQAFGNERVRDLPAAIRDTLPSRLALELEFAGPDEPLLGGTLAAAARRIRPGIDGIAIRRGTSIARSLPGRELATGTADATSSTIFRLLDELGLPPRDLPQLRELDQVSLRRFETIRIGQAASDEFPRVLLRAGDRVERGPLDPATLQAIRRRIVANLLGHRPADVEAAADRPRFLGDYDPIADRHDPFEATPADRLLVAWALAASGTAGSGDPTLDRRSKDAALALLRETTALELQEPACADLALLAATALDDYTEIGRVLETIEGGTSPADPVGLARRAAAIGATPANIADDAAFLQRLDDAWKMNRSVDAMVASFEWLALAERSRQRRTGESSPRLDALRAVRDSLLLRQERDATIDLAGGLEPRAGSRSTVDARTLRPGLGMAVLEHLPSDDPDANRRATVGVEGIVRFLRQLETMERDARLLPGWRKASGGLRVAPWSARQSVAANATAVLLLVESGS